VLECFRLNEYLKLDFSFSYLRTKDDVEVDLIIERPGQRDLLVEIKSKNRIVSDDARSLNFISKDWDKKMQAEIWSLDETEKKEGSVHCRYWQNAFDEYFRK
jgi:predicted AAA+ superfamily ATPase